MMAARLERSFAFLPIVSFNSRWFEVFILIEIEEKSSRLLKQALRFFLSIFYIIALLVCILRPC